MSKYRNLGFKVKATSTAELEFVAEDICEIFTELGYMTDGRLDAERVLEDLFPKLGFNFAIRSKEELNSIAACVYPDQQIIVVREDIYDDLLRNDGRARFTIAHELAHVILKHDLTLNRDSFAGNHQCFEDTEWQANNLGAAILMPRSIVIKYFDDPYGLMNHCGCSYSSALYRIKNVKKSSK